MIVYTAATALAVFLCFLSQGGYRTVAGRLSGGTKPSSAVDTASRSSNSSMYEKLFYILSALPLYLISAFRWNTGTDMCHTYAPEYLGMKWRFTEQLSRAEENFMRLCYSGYFSDYLPLKKIYPTVINPEMLSAPQESVNVHYAVCSEHTSAAFRLL